MKILHELLIQEFLVGLEYCPVWRKNVWIIFIIEWNLVYRRSMYWCGSEFPLGQHARCSARSLGFDPIHIVQLAGLESDIAVTLPTEFISVISISLSFSGGCRVSD